MGGGWGEGRGVGEELRTLLEHKGNGNVELRRFLGCSVASLRLAATPLSRLCLCGLCVLVARSCQLNYVACF